MSNRPTRQGSGWKIVIVAGLLTITSVGAARATDLLGQGEGPSVPGVGGPIVPIEVGPAVPTDSLPRGDTGTRPPADTRDPSVDDPDLVDPADLSGAGGGASTGGPGGGASGGGSGAGGSSGGGVIHVELGQETKNRVADLKRKTAKIDNLLYEELMARERARWNYEHGGAFDHDLAEFRRRQARIEKLQNERMSTLSELGNEIIRAKPEQRDRVRRAWAKAKADYEATKGLNLPKFINADERTSPSNPAEQEKWLHKADYQHKWDFSDQ